VLHKQSQKFNSVYFCDIFYQVTGITPAIENNQYAPRKKSENRRQTGIEPASLGIRPPLCYYSSLHVGGIIVYMMWVCEVGVGFIYMPQEEMKFVSVSVA